MIARAPSMKLFHKLLRDNSFRKKGEEGVPESDLNVLFTAHGFLYKNLPPEELPKDLPPKDGFVGLGTIGNVCAKKYGARAILERGEDVGGLTRVFLHEVGHLLGIHHNSGYTKKIKDFPEDLCKKEDPLTWTWTICNRCDLLWNYERIKKKDKKGKYCLDRN